MFEGWIDATLGQVPLHVSDVRMIATETQVLVEYPQEYVKDRVTGIVGAGLAVDIEQDDIGGVGDGLVDVCADHTVAHFLLVKEGDCGLAVAFTVMGFDVGKQVGKGFQEMRLTRTKEARDPHADAVGDGWISQVGAVGVKEITKVPLQLIGYDVLVQLLVDGGVVGLISLNHAVDWAFEVFEENVFDAHDLSSLIIREPA